ncbi:hypothetical protein ECAA86_00634 [Escherichia coli AA86]|nr:hypothetical protein ECAA86_00634 [Escherichia coli AA86]ESC91348.1 hypothetical protein HMPREF1594_04782 [Escherichia coli 907446]
MTQLVTLQNVANLLQSPSPKKETFQNFRISPSRSHFYTE